MTAHRAAIAWTTTASAEEFVKLRYSREHTWRFDGGVTVPGSSSPSVVPAPWSSAAAVDPEEAFVAAIASCHMLSFLYVAAKAGFAVERYADDAVGAMAKSPSGTPWVAKVTLAPVIAYRATPPTAAQEAELHHQAHHECFIAASVKTEIVVAGVPSQA